MLWHIQGAWAIGAVLNKCKKAYLKFILSYENFIICQYRSEEPFAKKIALDLMAFWINSPYTLYL